MQSSKTAELSNGQVLLDGSATWPAMSCLLMSSRAGCSDAHQACKANHTKLRHRAIRIGPCHGFSTTPQSQAERLVRLFWLQHSARKEHQPSGRVALHGQRLRAEAVGAGEDTLQVFVPLEDGLKMFGRESAKRRSARTVNATRFVPLPDHV